MLHAPPAPRGRRRAEACHVGTGAGGATKIWRGTGNRRRNVRSAQACRSPTVSVQFSIRPRLGRLFDIAVARQPLAAPDQPPRCLTAMLVTRCVILGNHGSPSAPSHLNVLRVSTDEISGLGATSGWEDLMPPRIDADALSSAARTLRGRGRGRSLCRCWDRLGPRAAGPLQDGGTGSGGGEGADEMTGPLAALPPPPAPWRRQSSRAPVPYAPVGAGMDCAPPRPPPSVVGGPHLPLPRRRRVE